MDSSSEFSFRNMTFKPYEIGAAPTDVSHYRIFVENSSLISKFQNSQQKSKARKTRFSKNQLWKTQTSSLIRNRRKNCFNVAEPDIQAQMDFRRKIAVNSRLSEIWRIFRQNLNKARMNFLNHIRTISIQRRLFKIKAKKSKNKKYFSTKQSKKFRNAEFQRCKN